MKRLLVTAANPLTKRIADKQAVEQDVTRVIGRPSHEVLTVGQAGGEVGTVREKHPPPSCVLAPFSATTEGLWLPESNLRPSN